MAKLAPVKNLSKLARLEPVTLDITVPKPNFYNPNRQSDKEFELLCRSIEEDGFTQPIIVVLITDDHLAREPKLALNDFHAGDYMIVDGEHRWRACRALGWTEIQTVVTNMTIEQVMVATLRHNRARGEENLDLAAQVLKQLSDFGAIDWAQDSLMIDNVEVRIMLEDIPNAELYLREPDAVLSAPEVEQMVAANREQAKQILRDEAQVFENEADSTFELSTEFSPAERAQVMKALFSLPGNTPGEQLVSLLTLYENDAEARKILELVA